MVYDVEQDMNEYKEQDMEETKKYKQIFVNVVLVGTEKHDFEFENMTEKEAQEKAIELAKGSADFDVKDYDVTVYGCE